MLATNRESLVDAIALAGGYRGDAKDAVARVQRDGQTFEIRLSDLLDMPQQDVQVAPGDRITRSSGPQSFSVLGAPNKAEEIDFPRGRLTWRKQSHSPAAPIPTPAMPRAIFVFRYVPQPNGDDSPPSII